MIDKEYLDSHFILNPPALQREIDEAQSKTEMTLPASYVDLLLLCNGLRSSGCLALHEIGDLPARNEEYEVPEYMPGYFIIGDDSGGQAILIDAAGKVFEVGMGVMDVKYMAPSADSLEDLLVNKRGLTLGERSEE